MYFENVGSSDLQVFKGLLIKNFSIKLSEIIHKTGGVFDNGLFRVEQLTNKIFRIIPLFYCESVEGSNPVDVILDNQCIIAHLEDDETYFTFISDENKPIETFYPFKKFYNIDDNLTVSDLNSVVFLMRENIVHSRDIIINNMVNTEFGDLEFDISNSQVVDTGFLFNSNNGKVRLTNPSFKYSNYILNGTIYKYVGVNVIDDIPVHDYKVVRPFSVELTNNSWVTFNIDEGDVLGFDAVIEVNHHKHIIQYPVNIELNIDKSFAFLNESVVVTGKVYDNNGWLIPNQECYLSIGGRWYSIFTDDAGIFTYGYIMGDFGKVEFEVNIDGVLFSNTVSCVVLNNNPPVNIRLTSTKTIINGADGEETKITARITDGNNKPCNNETVTGTISHIYGTENWNFNNNYDGTYSITYNAINGGDTVITANCKSLTATVNIEDCSYYNPYEHSITTDTNNKEGWMADEWVLYPTETHCFVFSVDFKVSRFVTGINSLYLINDYHGDNSFYVQYMRKQMCCGAFENGTEVSLSSIVSGTVDEYANFKIEVRHENVTYKINDVIVGTDTLSLGDEVSDWMLYYDFSMKPNLTGTWKNLKLLPLKDDEE